MRGFGWGAGPVSQVAKSARDPGTPRIFVDGIQGGTWRSSSNRGTALPARPNHARTKRCRYGRGWASVYRLIFALGELIKAAISRGPTPVTPRSKSALNCFPAIASDARRAGWRRE
jgi:hypothetical protein